LKQVSAGEAPTMWRFKLAILIWLCVSVQTIAARAMDDGEVVENSTEQFNKDEGTAEQQLANANFFSRLEPFALGARVTMAADVTAAVNIPSLGRGDPREQYDVILQPGHYGRTTGKVGTSGRQVSEQQLAAFVTANVAQHLIDQGVNVLVIPADDFDKSGLTAQIFLSIHADGAANPCTTGPSLGYAKGSSLLGMHSIGFALATSLGQTYDDFRKDNFTVNLHKYYAFRYIKAAGFSGLLEVGELTCPTMEKALIANALRISHNLGVALEASLRILEEPLNQQ
jgi:N-acetylmuramoyl-L-alanine amidase